MDLVDKPLLIIGPPGSGKTTFVVTLAMVSYLMGMNKVLYLTHKPGDAIGSIVTMKAPWGCVKVDLPFVLSAYEELSERPGISLLAARAEKFDKFRSFMYYTYKLARNPRNMHAQWLLERLRLLEDYVDDSRDLSINGLSTVIYNRNIRGVYQVISLVSTIINCPKPMLLIIDDITILPIRTEAIMRLMRILRGLANTWIVMHSIGRTELDDINVPTVLTHHMGLSKYIAKYQNALTKIKPGEVLYIGESIEVKIRISELLKINNELRRTISTHNHNTQTQ